MQKIIPHLWFDKEAKEAAEFYATAFRDANKDAKVTNHYVLKDTPSGDCDVMTFEIEGYTFMAISAGPYFKINSSISFMLNFDPSKDPNAEENLNRLWGKLLDGGKVMMELEEYPFSKRYGFLEDKYGVSWQLILTNPDGEPRPFLMPSLLFVGSSFGKAEEAVDYYLSVFRESKLGTRVKYESDMGPNKVGTVMFSDFSLFGQWFTAMDGGGEHAFNFNEAVSLMVNCETQEEIDYFWEKLSSDPKAEQCGWCKDKFGVSWQVVPSNLEDRLRSGTPEQVKRVTEAFLKMKKFNLAELDRAFKGE